MPKLTRFDRDVVELWAGLGWVPDGHSERVSALAILQRALHDVDEMHEIVRQLGRYAEVPQHESFF